MWLYGVQGLMNVPLLFNLTEIYVIYFLLIRVPILQTMWVIL